MLLRPEELAAVSRLRVMSGATAQASHRLGLDPHRLRLYSLQDGNMVSVPIFLNDRARSVVDLLSLSSIVRAWPADDPATAVCRICPVNVMERGAADLDLFPTAFGNAGLALMHTLLA